MNVIAKRVAHGAAAGIAATGLMTIALVAAKATGVLGEPPPKKLTRRILTLLGHRPSKPALHAATAVAHLAYGAGAGALYAALPPRVRGPVSGTLFGLGIWAVSYMGWIPKLALMRPPSRDRRGRPTAMALAHVVFGAALDAGMRVKPESRPS